ncbi:MAG TPA: SAM-dependent methyltransferase, partial [Afipia sp.]|nr:SAM-dependent methyltransferase [Afipia sp.]
MTDRPPSNVDPAVAAGFGHEWSTFRQGEDAFSADDRAAIFESYFHIFPWDRLPASAVGMDVRKSG